MIAKIICPRCLCGECENSFKFVDDGKSIYCNKDGKFHDENDKPCKSFEKRQTKYQKKGIESYDY